MNKKIITTLILPFVIWNLALGANHLAFAVPQDSQSALIPGKQIITDPDNIVIPREAGLVKYKFNGNGGKIVVHIQDAHCNFEAQSNIVKIIENLIKNNNLKFISVEGADGIIDTSWFKAFPDDEVRKEVATYFMKKGEITGPEYISITSDYPLRLFGAETRSYYIENLNAFTSSYPMKEETEKYFAEIKTALGKIKNHVYSDELKLLDSKIYDYESKKIPFNDYVRFLQEMAEKHKVNLRNYGNLFKLISVLMYEKMIDFKLTDKERSALIDELGNKLSKDGLAKLVAQSIAFKSNKISSAEYYGYVKEIANENGIELAKKYPNLHNYIIYNSVYSKIENEKLFKDVEKLETVLKESLFQNEDQRLLDKLSRHIDILIDLVNIKLLNGDIAYYQAHKEEFSYGFFIDFISKKAAQYGLFINLEPPRETVAKNMSRLEDFYKIAIKRDKALVDNTLKAMEKDSEKIAVLVTGGFHSEGIAKLLEEQGISYMVICPVITKDVPTPYIQVLTNQKSTVEDIMVDAGGARQGILSPFLISWAIRLKEKELQKLSSEVKGAPMVGRVIRVKDGWITLHLKNWLGRAFEYARNHRLADGREVMREAYRLAMRNALLDLAATDARYKGLDIDGTIDGIMNSEAFNEEFDRIFDKQKSDDGHVPEAVSTQPALTRADMTPAQYAEYIDETYVRKDSEELRGALSLVRLTQASNRVKKVVLLLDTALDRDAQHVVQAGERTVARYLGDSFIEVRGTGKKLYENAEQEIRRLVEEERLTLGEDLVVVTEATPGSLAEIGYEDELKRPFLGRIVQIENSDTRGKRVHIPVIGLYELAVRLGFLGNPKDGDNIEGLRRCLNRIARDGNNNEFTPNDIKELLEKGGPLALRPIQPYDPNEAHDAYMAALQALRSL